MTCCGHPEDVHLPPAPDGYFFEEIPIPGSHVGLCRRCLLEGTPGAAHAYGQAPGITPS